MKNIRYRIFTILTILLLVGSCSYYEEDEIFQYPNLLIDEYELEVAKGGSMNVKILSGSLKYELISSEPDVVDATISNNTIILKGKEIGSSIITLTDVATNEQQTLEVEVISPYIEMIVDLKPGDQIEFLVNADDGVDDVWVDLNGNNQKESHENIVLGVPNRYILESNTIRIYGKANDFQMGNFNVVYLDVSKSPYLVDFACEGNKNLTSLDFSNNLRLETISVKWNSLTELKLPTDTANQLIELSCQYNNLRTINTSGCRKMYFFDCKHNQITELDLKYNTEIFALVCNSNRLSNLDVSNCFYSKIITLQDENTGEFRKEKVGLKIFFSQDNKYLDCIKISEQQLRVVDSVGYLEYGLWQKDEGTILTTEGCY